MKAKKAILFIIIAALSLTLTGCLPLLMFESPSRYSDEEAEYYNGGEYYIESFGNEWYSNDSHKYSITYEKYYYTPDIISSFESYRDFNKTTEEDIVKLKGFFDSFSEKVKFEVFADQYDFDSSKQIKVGDYFKIELLVGNANHKTIEVADIEKLNFYYIEYFDKKNLIMYSIFYDK